MSIGVRAVMRRFSRADRSRVQPFASRCSCITVTPCAACMNATACGWLVQPLLARIGLHAGAAMAGPDEFARSRIHGSRRRGRAPRDRHFCEKYATASALVPNWRSCAPTASASSQVVCGETARVEIGRAGYETVTPARDDVVAIAVGDRERIVVLRRDAGERRGGAAPPARCVGTCAQAASPTVAAAPVTTVRRDRRAARTASKVGRFMGCAC